MVSCFILFFLPYTLVLSQNVSQEYTSRIVDGDLVEGDEFPFVVSLIGPLKGRIRHTCTGSILNDNTVLTASHCFAGRQFNVSQLTAYIGNTDISSPKEKYQFHASQVILHEKYHRNGHALLNDIAVVKFPLNSFSSFSDKRVKKICLPNADDEPDSNNCIAMGWGKLQSKGPVPNKMHKIGMSISDKCQADVINNPKINFCAFGSKGKGGVCYGDSGGPLVCPLKSDPKRWLQFGVCSNLDLPRCGGLSYYSKVNQYLEWLKTQAEK